MRKGPAERGRVEERGGKMHSYRETGERKAVFTGFLASYVKTSGTWLCRLDAGGLGELHPGINLESTGLNFQLPCGLF